MANESAIIAPIPEVEPMVGPLRHQYDPAASLGVPAHITLLYPFLAPANIAIELGMLSHICSAIEAFEFFFIEVRRFPETVYLHPDRSERFEEITRTLVKTWPDCKPYGGIHSEIVPHLTVADRVNTQTMSFIEESIRSRLPIRCSCREVWLMASDDQGKWSRKAHFPLSGSHPA